MSNLNPIEQECREVLATLLDLMCAGRRKLSAKDHTELTGTVRDCLYRLVRKDNGCAMGRHTTDCTCTTDHVGQPVAVIKYHHGGSNEH